MCIRDRVATRFEIHVECSAARVITGGLERQDFGVLSSVIGVESFANYAVVANEDRADHGIRARQSFAPTRQSQCAIHPMRVIIFAIFVPKGRHGSSVKEGIYESFGIERDEIIHLFADADKTNRQA